MFRITGIESKIKNLDTFMRLWYDNTDFILNGYADYGEVGLSNGFINKTDYEEFKDINVEVITSEGNYIVSSDLLYK